MVIIIFVQEQALVNSTGQNLNLSQGGVSEALSRKAGPQLQAACNMLAPLKVGEVKKSIGFNLQCKHVLHCLCPKWQGPGSGRVSMYFTLLYYFVLSICLVLSNQRLMNLRSVFYVRCKHRPQMFDIQGVSIFFL